MRDWGRQLRFSAPPRVIEAFYREIQPQLRAFTLFGSGDFHHLSALWIRNVDQPITVISFDNHPDWDVRPPKWSCGGWTNRALDLSHVRKVSVWGCGNFECWWPRQFFGNRRAERAGRLNVHPWVDHRPAADQQRRGAIRKDSWRERFEQSLAELRGESVYVTVDIDCLVASDAVTNWENGYFTATDVDWALGRLRENCSMIGGDLCGAYSEPQYARRKQRFASEMDHPKLELPAVDEIRRINFGTLNRLWPALVG